jgi:hypothetical protein
MVSLAAGMWMLGRPPADYEAVEEYYEDRHSMWIVIDLLSGLPEGTKFSAYATNSL